MQVTLTHRGGDRRRVEVGDIPEQQEAEALR
jgi:hypothetical protein